MTTHDPTPIITFADYARYTDWPRSHGHHPSHEDELRRAIMPFLTYFGSRPITQGPTLPELVSFSRLAGPGATHAALQFLWDATGRVHAAETRRTDVPFRPSPAATELSRAIDGGLPAHKAPMLNTFIHFIGELGLRPGEAISLRWEDVGLEADRIVVPGSAGRAPHARRRVITVFPETRRMLKLHRETTGRRGYVFQREGSGRPMSLHAIRRLFEGLASPHASDGWPTSQLLSLRYLAALWMLTPPPDGPGLTLLEVANQLGIRPTTLGMILRKHGSRHYPQFPL